jgi:hypothetical protein
MSSKLLLDRGEDPCIIGKGFDRAVVFPIPRVLMYLASPRASFLWTPFRNLLRVG